MTGWDDLKEELDAWAAVRNGAGRQATFWWRDDDAVVPTPPLCRLLDIAAAADVPVALAVIPRDTGEPLRLHLETRPQAFVLQHGWSHDNHAPDGERQEEFGVHRPLPVMLDELTRGWAKLSVFARALPVMVAPWNRMDAHLLAHLPSAGLGAVSTLGPRGAAEPVAGVRRVNVHVDIMDWQGTRGFIGLDRALDQVIGHLRARRTGDADADEPTGLMTHHSFHDEDCWRFIAEFLGRTRDHPAARWLAADKAFWP